jgi:Rieske Fe-S protein
VGRRRFLEMAALSLGTAVAGGCATVAAVPAPVEGGRVRLRVAEHPGLAGPGGYLKVLPAGWSVPLLVLADGEGGWSALSPVCTHLGCVVEVQGRVLICPCHGSTYQRSGAVVRGPAERALTSFRVREEPAGTLVVELEGRVGG